MCPAAAAPSALWRAEAFPETATMMYANVGHA